MRIISPFKDYYDHVAYIYGGGDNRHVYQRSIITPKKEDFCFFDDIVEETSDKIVLTSSRNNNLGHLPHFYDGGKYLYMLCCIAGQQHYLRRHVLEEPEFKLINIKDLKKDDSYLLTRFEHYLLTQFEQQFKQINKDLLSISRDLDAPVFMISSIRSDGRKFHFYINKKIPTLSNYGFASVISPEQMYQNIEYFISNLINECPDLAPIPKPPMTNKEKILSHGFDLKKSFRHRK